MLVYNTLTQKKEPLPEPQSGQPLRVFVCGPTVYDFIHIGNARTYMSFDIIVRYFRLQREKVFYLQNITDIDDKIIARANEEGVSWKSITQRYTRAFFMDMKKLNIASVTKYAPATKFTSEIVRQVKALVEKGNAYVIEGDGYYFDLSTFPDYGHLARRTIEQAEDGVSRIDTSDKKRNRGDFCLWKFSKPGEPSWSTELGLGRPGWHIEDTAITEHFFGPQYDIHGGGVDLIFPHHEAEIAQQESASGKKPFVKSWMHAGLIRVDGKKMSKSLGNFVTTQELLKHYSPDTFRMAVFMHHYRSSMDYTETLMHAAQKNLSDIETTIAKLEMKRPLTTPQTTSNVLLAEFEKKFTEAMQDDINTPAALASIFELLNALQPYFWTISPRDAKKIAKTLRDTLRNLGFRLKTPMTPLRIKFLARKRERSRSSKQFMQSDALRKKIEDLGYTVEDTPLGPFIWPKSRNV